MHSRCHKPVSTTNLWSCRRRAHSYRVCFKVNQAPAVQERPDTVNGVYIANKAPPTVQEIQSFLGALSVFLHHEVAILHILLRCLYGAPAVEELHIGIPFNFMNGCHAEPMRIDWHSHVCICGWLLKSNRSGQVHMTGLSSSKEIITREAKEVPRCNTNLCHSSQSGCKTYQCEPIHNDGC